MVMMMLWLLVNLAMVTAVPSATKEANNQGYKDQYCTDPRTMRKHPAYTEWADAYSCTRHRCQPGGRKLAIYTVGCKRVEAPESAIECEEVVEDTNMQFPFCCTRLRCLVVVRGEVWTRVLGQPWEVLPAAPWSHMYKMKKPPPTDSPFQPKIIEQGPIYELTETDSDNEKAHEKTQKSARKVALSTTSDCNEVVPRASSPPPPPDIVIALSTNNERDYVKNSISPRHQADGNSGTIWRASSADSDNDMEPNHSRKNIPPPKQFFDKDDDKDHAEPDIQDIEDPTVVSEKEQIAWTEIPRNQWDDHEGMDAEAKVNVMELRYTKEPGYRQETQPQLEVKVVKKDEKIEKPNNLQALVDAIGTRMKDIESVVQRMSEKVHQPKTPSEVGFEKRVSSRNRVSKYLHQTTEQVATETPNLEDNGNYFSDASNAVRRAILHPTKESVPKNPTYMAPVDTHHKAVHITMVSDTAEDMERRKKKHGHKKRKSKNHIHKKHHNQERRKHFNKLSVENDKNTVSLEDSSDVKD